MRVIAVEQGYDGLMVRSPDAFDAEGKPIVFEMPDGATGKWFVPVDENDKPVAPIKAKAKAKHGDPVPGQGPKRGSQVEVPGASKHAADVNVNPIA